jgi:Arm DNA-binding domain
MLIPYNPSVLWDSVWDDMEPTVGGKLTAVTVKALVKPGRHTDGGGLHLHIRGPDKRAWVLRYMLRGKCRDMGLGPYPEVSLAQARERAAAARQLLRGGKDPLEARRAEDSAQAAATGRTFRIAADELLADKSRGWRNAKHRWQWQTIRSTMRS